MEIKCPLCNNKYNPDNIEDFRLHVMAHCKDKIVNKYIDLYVKITMLQGFKK